MCKGIEWISYSHCYFIQNVTFTYDPWKHSWQNNHYIQCEENTCTKFWKSESWWCNHYIWHGGTATTQFQKTSHGNIMIMSGMGKMPPSNFIRLCHSRLTITPMAYPVFRRIYCSYGYSIAMYSMLPRHITGYRLTLGFDHPELPMLWTPHTTPVRTTQQQSFSGPTYMTVHTAPCPCTPQPVLTASWPYIGCYF